MKIKFKLAKSKTCWWHNDFHPNREFNFRVDVLFGIQRLYCRDLRYYTYEISIGRLIIFILPEFK